MTGEERDRMTSEDFADLLITYSGDQSAFANFQDATVHIINFFYAVVHVPVSQINNDVILKYGYSAMPTLYGPVSQASLEASGILRLRSIPNFNLRGHGVLVGIIDSGIDYTNPVFQNADKTSRIVSIWDQTIQSDNFPPNAGYGTEYTREQLNAALSNENPLSVVPSTDEIGHGTMVAGIAAGNEVPDSNFYGVAPDSELVVVKLKQAKKYLRDFFLIKEGAPCYESIDILFGIDYLRRTAIALNRPIAVCISVNTSFGSHDGRQTLTSYLSLRSRSAGFGVVIAAGNEGNSRRHYFGRINETTGYDTVELSVGENEQGFTMELWGDAPGLFSVDIQSPSGEYIPRIIPRLDENREISFVFERTIIYLDYQIIESQSGDELILFRFKNPAAGIWRFNVYGALESGLGFHIWLPMEGFISDNTFFIRSDPYTTVLALGTGRYPITVTAYNNEDDSLYLDASRGFTRTGVIKPEIAAPGVNITAPSLNNTFVEATGTSAAAAHTTGVAALLFEWAIVKGNQPSINTLDMKIFMIRGARRDLELEYPNRDWGYGILDVFNIFDILRRSE
jgi:subtilisin family serine protease